MPADVYRFEFDRSVPLADAEMSLHLALFAVEGLYGQARVRLDGTYRADEQSHVIIINGATEVGAAIARVFTNLLVREFGEEAFKVRAMESQPRARAEERAA
jgi:hypothetical protein